MGLCELDKYRSISDLRKKSVISQDGLVVGRIIDVVIDSNYKLHSFIIGGSRWEELKELMGFVDDIDPVIPCESITEITDDTIKINIQKDKLRHKLEEGIIPENAFTYSNLKRVKIYDSNDNKFGKIVNMVFLPSGELVFVLGGSWLEEFAEKIKFKEDIDLLLPLNEISLIKDQMIKLRMPIAELELSMNNVPMDEKTQRNYLNSLKVKGQVEMRLLERRKAEEFRDFARFY